MKRFFKKKKSASESGSVASGGKSESGYNIQTKKELSKLHKAAFTGDLSKLKSLLKKGDVNQLDKENRTPLHLACSNGKIDAIIMLAGQHGCNLNLCDNDKRSPLMILVQCQFYNCMNVLLQKDADVNLSDNNGNTALHLAASIPSNDLCISLIDYHANVHAKNKDGSTPLHLASSAAESENVIKTLLDDGAQINAKDNNGKTPLMLAASRGHLEVVKDLLNRGADASLRDAKGWCADDYASMSGHHPISHVIVEHSVKQKKTPSRQSLQSVSTGSGSRLYEDIPAASASNMQKLNDNSSHFLVGGPAMDAGDLSQDDESQTVSRMSDDKDSWNSDSDSPPPKKTLPATKAGAPKVNVAQFLKQREQHKNQPSSSSANRSPATPKLQSASSGKSPKDNMEVTDSPSANSALRPRGYASNSQKGGQVSPAKPPLPKSKNNGMQSPALPPRGAHEEEDSPWDSDEESDSHVQAQRKDNSVTSPGKHTKPSRDVMAELGLSDADINQIYDNNESDISSMRSQSPDKQPTSEPVYSVVQKKKLSLDQSDSEEEDSSTWDDESDIEESPRDKRALTDLIAESSVLKFDDEISEQNDVIEQAAAPPSVLEQIEANELHDDDDVVDDSSSWDSEDVVVRPTKRRPSPLKTSADGVLSPSDDDDDFDTESESSWEVENRKKHDGAKSAAQLAKDQVALENERKQREKEEEDERLKEERLRLQAEKEELQRREEAKRLQRELRQREEEEEKQRKDAEEKRKQQAKKDKQMKIAMEAMEKKRKNEEARKRKEEEAERLRIEAEKKRKADEQLKENLRKEKKDAEDKRRREVEERRRQDEEKRKKDEEEKRMREEEQRRRLLASTEKEKLTTALQNALDGAGNPSESDISEFDDFHMGNVQGSNKRKMEGFKHSNVALPPMYTRRDPTFPSQKSNGVHGVNGIDIDNLTGTETETEDDFPAEVPVSLQTSQLSESLLRSGERGELEREASREKHRAIDALEQLDISKRENEKLRDEIRNLKLDKKEAGKIRDDLEARMRKMNFDLNRTKEELQTAHLEVDTSRDRHNRLEQKLEIDAGERRKQESALVELREELGHTEMRLKEAERDRDKFQTELSVERRKMALRDHVDDDKQRADVELNEKTSTIQRQVDAWNLLLQEKDDELCKAKAGLATMESACERYKDELARSRLNEDDDLLRINSQLNDRVMEMEQNWRESREALEHAAVKYNLQLHHLKQANDMLTEELRKERKQKSDSQHDLETLNDQQRSLKDRIGELERKCYREEDKSEALTRNVKEEKEKREDAEKKYRDAEISTNLAQQEANSLRTALTHKDSLLIQAQREREEAREKLSRSEKEANELQRENVRMSGRVEILEAEVSQQESEKMRMRRELEDARNFGTSTLTAQQGQLSEIVTGQQKERIELEKRNAQLEQQVSHLREEIKRVSDEKLKKEEELAVAQQDYIETHKRMSFTEPSMAQMREEKNKMEIEIQQLKERCSNLDSRLAESTRAAEDVRNELERARQSGSNAHNRLQSVETISAHDKTTIEKLEERLKTAEATNARLESEVASHKLREEEMKSSQEFTSRSRMQMEDLVARLQEDKTAAEQKLQERIDRCRILEAEAEGHRKMWEEEVKLRSKLNVQYARADKERNDAISRLESTRSKYSRAAEQSKAYKSKLDLQKRHRSKLEDQLETYSEIARKARFQSESSESEFELRLSQASDDFRAERRRLNDTIGQLQGHVTSLTKKLREEARARSGAEREVERLADTSRTSDASVAEVERERDLLRKELERLRRSGPTESGASPEQINAMVNSKLNSKLGQVNNFLEEQAAAHDILERMRVENEEKRVAEANERAFALEQELQLVRSKMGNSSGPDSERRRRELQDSVRENIKLQEELQRTKLDLEKQKMQVDHEQKKYQNLYASVLSGTMAGKVGSGSLPLNHTMTSTKGLSPQKSHDHIMMTSTPRRELSEPILSHLRNKLDVSLAQRLSESRLQRTGSPSSDGSGSNQRRPDRAASNEYMSFLLT